MLHGMYAMFSFLRLSLSDLFHFAGRTMAVKLSVSLQMLVKYVFLSSHLLVLMFLFSKKIWIIVHKI